MALKFELVLIVYKQNNEQTQYRDLIPKSEKRSKLKDT